MGLNIRAPYLLFYYNSIYTVLNKKLPKHHSFQFTVDLILRLLHR